MRILLISDIHSNLAALETVLAAAGSFDQVWCLGDVVGYGPAPNECVEKLASLNARSLAGNHDWAVLGKLDVQEFNGDARRAVHWTRSVLTSDNMAWLRQLPERQTLPEYDLTLVHGSPRHPIWEYIFSAAVAAQNMQDFETGVCLFGHTHIPALYYQRQPARGTISLALEPERPVTLEPKMLLNPGSVGQPRDRDPRAAYAILDLDSRTVTPYRVEYDIAQTQQAMAKVDLPPRLIARLQFGV